MINGNEQIQPVVKPGFTYSDGSYEETTVQDGLTIRQQFAAMAMQGMLSANYGDFNNDHNQRIAELAVIQADALIAELNKQQA